MTALKDKIKQDGSEIRKELRSKTLGYIGTALGLVAGLAWNQAVQSFIQKYFPMDKHGVLAQFVYAIGVTFIIVIVLYLLTKFLTQKGDENQD